MLLPLKWEQLEVCKLRNISFQSKRKRPFRNVLYLQEAFEMTMCNAVPLNLGNVGGLQWCGEPKRLETEASSGQQLSSLNLSSPFDLNFPLPGEKGPACLVKVRKSLTGLMLTKMC